MQRVSGLMALLTAVVVLGVLVTCAPNVPGDHGAAPGTPAD
jgi:hypothetical protein